METWAHGQDVADALGVTREPTDRLRHVGAHRGAGHAVQLRAARPAGAHRPGPGGADRARWRVLDLGSTGRSRLVRGPALDFCLLVTQRRHRADLALRTTGPVPPSGCPSRKAFAGEPGKGRRPAALIRQGTHRPR